MITGLLGFDSAKIRASTCSGSPSGRELRIGRRSSTSRLLFGDLGVEDVAGEIEIGGPGLPLMACWKACFTCSGMRLRL